MSTNDFVGMFDFDDVIYKLRRIIPYSRPLRTGDAVLDTFGSPCYSENDTWKKIKKNSS